MTEVSDALYEEVASFLNFTWEDSKRTERIKGYILSSAQYLESIANSEIVFESAEGKTVDYLAKDLLLNRVLYMDSQALDDFAKNYVNELNTLRITYEVVDATED